MNACVKAAGYDIEICAPYLDKAKWWIGGTAQNMGIPLESTWSCYFDSESPCGTCPACLKRATALAANDLA
jgi:7-cyano-7-deazaguanine synthase